jgi:two-component system nitrate/nitrite response regulator NarL
MQGSVSTELIVLQGRSPSPLRYLSEREKQAAMLFGAGNSTKEIARRLDVTNSTVRNFIQRAYKKLGVRDKAELAVLIASWSAVR